MTKLFNKLFALVMTLLLFYFLIFPILVSMKSDIMVAVGFGGIVLTLYLFGRSLIKYFERKLK